MVEQIVAQLIEHGEVKRGKLGFTAQDLTPELAEAFDIDQQKGVVVARVEEGSPADKAGMKAGDIIISVNGDAIEDSADVRNVIGLIRVGTKIDIEIVRNGKVKLLHAKIAETKSKTIAGEKLSEKLAGAHLSLTEIGQRGGLAKQVIIVSKLEPGSPAATAGLRKGDIILSVNKRPVENFEEMEKAIVAEPRGVLLNIQRGNRGLFILIR